MWRRLYLTFPDSQHARQVTQELERDGIQPEQIHAMSRNGDDLQDLPAANDDQQRDRVWFWEQLYWYGNLGVFAAALVGFVAAAMYGDGSWMVVTAAIMLTTFLMGNHFASNIPHAHLNEMQGPLSHGEVVLMVDLPKEQVQKVDHDISHRHPEAGGHVVGWIIPEMPA